MNRIYFSLLPLLIVWLFTCASASADENKAGSSQVTQKAKAKNTGADNSEVEEARKILSKLPPHKKGRLTRLLNSGTFDQLVELPGIGETSAKAIIKARPFDTSADVVKIKGIGTKTYQKMVNYIGQT